MGMTTDCGICGKYYKSCSHYLKEHIAYSKHNNITLCGRKNVILLNDGWEGSDIDPNDVCKLCAKNDMYFQSRYKLVNSEYEERKDHEKDYVIYEDI